MGALCSKVSKLVTCIHKVEDTDSLPEKVAHSPPQVIIPPSSTSTTPSDPSPRSIQQIHDIPEVPAVERESAESPLKQGQIDELDCIPNSAQYQNRIVESKANIEKTVLQTVLFRWEGNAQSVLLAGSFLGSWEKQVSLTSGVGQWSGEYDLSPGVHQFKFIVDGQWVCSSLYPTLNDGTGMVNNCITICS